MAAVPISESGNFPISGDAVPISERRNTLLDMATVPISELIGLLVQSLESTVNEVRSTSNRQNLILEVQHGRG